MGKPSVKGAAASMFGGKMVGDDGLEPPTSSV
jgi:hypothetical protein